MRVAQHAEQHQLLAEDLLRTDAVAIKGKMYAILFRWKIYPCLLHCFSCRRAAEHADQGAPPCPLEGARQSARIPAAVQDHTESVHLGVVLVLGHRRGRLLDAEHLETQTYRDVISLVLPFCRN